jgi:CHAT domain-containing protein/tetratricopeptide (TPR) repeat protein
MVRPLAGVVARLFFAASVLAVGTTHMDSVGKSAEPDGRDVDAAFERFKKAFERGDANEAIVAAEAYTHALEQQHGEGSRESTDGYTLQARVLADFGQHAAARAARAKALAILPETEDQMSRSDAMKLLGLAIASENLKDFDVAANLAIRSALSLQRGGHQVPSSLADVLANGAIHAGNESRPWQEEHCWELGLWATASTHGRGSSQHLVFLKAVASFYENRQRYREAAALWEEAIAIRESKPDVAHHDLAVCRLGAARCFELMGDYAKAEAIGRQAAERLAQRSGRHGAEEAEPLSVLSRACAHQGKWEEAESLAKQAIAIVEGDRGARSKEANEARQTLALIFALQGRLEEAEVLVRRSLADSAQEKEGQGDVALYLSALASLLWEAGKHDEAEQIFVKTIAKAERDWGSDSVALALVNANLAANYFYQGRYEESERLTRQSLATLRDALGEGHPRVAMMHINLATAEAAQGRWAKAAEDNDNGCRGMARQIREQLAVLPAVEQLRLLRGQYAIGYQAALTMGLLQRKDPRIRALSAGWLVNGKAIAHEASARQAQLSAQRRSDAQGESAVPWVDIDSLRAHIANDSVLIDIARFRVFNYAARRKGEDWQPARYVAWIVPPSGKGLVEVVDLGEAAVIDAAVAAYRETLRAAVGDEGSVAKVGEALAEQELKDSAKLLVDTVLRPLMAGVAAAGCAESTKELIVSPDGELWLLPWAALPLDDGRYLVEQHAIATVTSARELLPSANSSPSTGSLVFANPSFDLSATAWVTAVEENSDSSQKAGTHMETSLTGAGATQRSVSEVGRALPLKATVREARRVAERIEDVTGMKPQLFLEDRALEDRVKRVRSPRILHFATHGFALPDQVASADRIERQSMLSSPYRPIQGLTSESGEPLEDPLLRCGLLLAGCNTPAKERPEGVEDGCLTGKEILALDLRGTELVVLSACDTGLGRVQYGEGVAGLRQAFLIAGAETVLASLWQVPDAGTADLVAMFFDRLADDRGKARALRDAQIDAIEKRRKAKGGAHPAAWAAFQVTGR